MTRPHRAQHCPRVGVKYTVSPENRVSPGLPRFAEILPKTRLEPSISFRWHQPCFGLLERLLDLGDPVARLVPGGAGFADKA